MYWNLGCGWYMWKQRVGNSGLPLWGGGVTHKIKVNGTLRWKKHVFVPKLSVRMRFCYETCMWLILWQPYSLASTVCVIVRKVRHWSLRWTFSEYLYLYLLLIEFVEFITTAFSVRLTLGNLLLNTNFIVMEQQTPASVFPCSLLSLLFVCLFTNRQILFQMCPYIS